MRLLFSSVLALLLCACSEESETITFETVTADKTVALTADSLSPTCSVNIRLEQATPSSGRAGEIINATVTERLLDHNDDNMQKSAEAYVDEYTSNYLRTLLPLYNQDSDDIHKQAWYHYHYIINSHTQAGSKGTLVYLADLNYREGGNHAINQQVIMNFEAKTGRLLNIRDVFIEGFEEQLKPILLKALQEKTGLATMKALHDNGYLNNSDIYVPENFILGSDAITFVFNPDEIAPYTIGSIELTIAYAAVDRILSSMFEY
ncbi:MAG: DUF3298 domain-containing protein [Prevotella sp.]|nr:DUF3298 domain-containing protein [Prevotella sp.]